MLFQHDVTDTHSTMHKCPAAKPLRQAIGTFIKMHQWNARVCVDSTTNIISRLHIARYALPDGLGQMSQTAASRHCSQLVDENTAGYQVEACRVLWPLTLCNVYPAYFISALCWNHQGSRNTYASTSPAYSVSLLPTVKSRCRLPDRSFPRDTTHSCRADSLVPSFVVAGSRDVSTHANAHLLSALPCKHRSTGTEM